MMWQLSVLALVSAATPPIGPVVVSGIAFGPRMTLTCKWFTISRIAAPSHAKITEKLSFPPAKTPPLAARNRAVRYWMTRLDA